MGFFRDFQKQGRFLKSLNASFLVLIPKKKKKSSLYKLLAKVLANWLKKVVSLSQNAFMEERQIMDASLIANKAINSLLKDNDYGLFVSLMLTRCMITLIGTF